MLLLNELTGPDGATYSHDCGDAPGGSRGAMRARESRIAYLTTGLQLPLFTSEPMSITGLLES